MRGSSSVYGSAVPGARQRNRRRRRKASLRRFRGTHQTHVEEAVDKRLPRDFEERITNNIEERLSGAFEQRIKTHINLFEQRAGLRMQMHFENLETKVTLAADGYGATLKKIERELVDLNKKVDEKFADHDLVLTDHNRRNNRA